MGKEMTDLSGKLSEHLDDIKALFSVPDNVALCLMVSSPECHGVVFVGNTPVQAVIDILNDIKDEDKHDLKASLN